MRVGYEVLQPAMFAAWEYHSLEPLLRTRQQFAEKSLLQREHQEST